MRKYTRDTVYLSLSRDILNHELPSLSPVSITKITATKDSYHQFLDF